MGNLYQCGRIAVLCALASIRRFKAASRAFVGWLVLGYVENVKTARNGLKND